MWTGSEGKCRCPFHSDKAPSFGVNAEKGTWVCYAGCGGGGIKDLAERLGVEPPWKTTKPTKTPVRKETLYNYMDRDGKLIFQVVRTDSPEGKRVSQRRPDGSGGWIWDLKTIKDFPPYRLPELLEGIKAGKWIFIAEGEKCVDALVKEGFIATTNHGGAGKWRDCHSAHFPAGTHTAVLYDNDKAGIKHLEQVTKALHTRGCRVKVVDLGYPYGEKHSRDIYDWFAEGHTKEELMELVRKTEFRSPGESDQESMFDDFDGVPIPEDEEQPRERRRERDESSVNFPDIGFRGAIKATIPNLLALMNHYGVVVRYDEIKKDVRMTFKEGNPYSVDNNENASIGRLISMMESEELPTRHVEQFLLEIADKSRVNPVKSWITSKAWDGRDRILPLCDTLEEKSGYPCDLKELLVSKWLLSSVAAACHESDRPFMTRGVLVLAGEQYIGKGRWFMSLAPREWVKDGHLLDPNNKDLVREAISHWIVELGELESTFRRDIGKIKAFLTKESDQIRIPYARGLSRFPRRTVFGASVNKPDFLIDDTGNTRFWTVPVEKIHHNHDIDTQQLFAQLHVRYRQGEQWWLTAEENKRLEALNEDYKERDEVYDLLMSRADWSKLDDDMTEMAARWLTPTEVLIEVCGIDRPTRAQRNSCAKLLRQLSGMENGQRFHRGAAKYPVPQKRTMYNAM